MVPEVRGNEQKLLDKQISSLLFCTQLEAARGQDKKDKGIF